ncbi:TPA: addiction module antidote protein, HigA family, partial [Vibrio cholerae]|nr:addiction module antidote protein, HigA family [Vibrio cholerae]HDV5368925.1 addiction module antidote protein, HigA family [Vibrio cholerae]HDV5457486.1 addiction module antidote protein, HigA family [Vibrio cholerae]HDV5534780.1 addiction module antidote protein, HigA family [Vibrio cholerae]HDV5564514.1 addiction module antidote protein, HigA family [Vibrio cholerae]
NRYQEEAKFVKPLFVSLEQSART